MLKTPMQIGFGLVVRGASSSFAGLRKTCRITPRAFPRFRVGVGRLPPNRRWRGSLSPGLTLAWTFTPRLTFLWHLKPHERQSHGIQPHERRSGGTAATATSIPWNLATRTSIRKKSCHGNVNPEERVMIGVTNGRRRGGNRETRYRIRHTRGGIRVRTAHARSGCRGT